MMNPKRNASAGPLAGRLEKSNLGGQRESPVSCVLFTPVNFKFGNERHACDINAKKF